MKTTAKVTIHTCLIEPLRLLHESHMKAGEEPNPGDHDCRYLGETGQSVRGILLGFYIK